MVNTTMKLTQEEVDAMPLEEKLELSEALWESIYASSESLPEPDWHKELLDKRLQDPNPRFDTWENVRKRLEQA